MREPFFIALIDKNANLNKACTSTFIFWQKNLFIWKNIMTHQNQIVLIILIAISIGAWIFVYKKDIDSSTNIASTIIVGTNAEYPPFSLRENNDIVGFDIDIIKEVAHRLGKQIIIKDMPFEALIPHIQLGSIHIIAAGMTPSPERAQQVFFTLPHLTKDPLIILSAKNNPIATIDDLHDKRLVVNEGFTADYYVSSLKIPHIIRLSSIEEGLLSLQSGRADGFVTAQSAVKPFFALHGESTFAQHIIPNTQEEYALVISKKYPELYMGITKIMNDMEKDGTINQIKKKWHL